MEWENLRTAPSKSLSALTHSGVGGLALPPDNGPQFYSSMGWAALITKSFHVTEGAYWMILLYKVQKQAKSINGEKDSDPFEEKGLVLGKGQESNVWGAAGKVLALGGVTWVCSFCIIHQAVHV